MQSLSRVFRRFGSYHLDLGRDENGKRRSKKLCRIVDGEAALYDALAKATRPGGNTMSDLFRDFQLFGMTELAPRTRIDYAWYIKKTLEPAFGHMVPDDVQSQHVAQLLETRKKAGARSVANKEAACLSSVFQYGLRSGRVGRDPTRGVRRNRVKPRDRYARHQEFLAHFEAAPEWLQDIMAGIYLMELRPAEARALQTVTLHDEGVVIEETKRGKVKVVKWSTALRTFVDRSRARARDTEYVFTNSRGDPVTKWAMSSAIRRVRDKLGLSSEESFTFHDLRAKGESEHEHGGHELLTLYKRAKVFEPVVWMKELK